MANIPADKIDERWSLLPQKLKDALFSEQNRRLIYNLCQAHNLDEYSSQSVLFMTNDVIYGFAHSDQFEKNIIQEVKLEPKIASIIADEIKAKIFSPLREELIKIYNPLPEIYKQQTIEAKKTISAPLPSADEKKEQTINIQPKDLRIFQPLKPAFPDSESASGQQTAEKQQTGRPPEKNKQKTPEPPAPKIVHYSDLRTPLNEHPQKSVQTATTQEQSPSVPEKISPENIVDLKDLPL